MISYAFVNSSFEPIYSAESNNVFVRESREMCNDLFRAIEVYEEHCDNVLFESSIFDEVNEEEMLALESEKKNIFTRIGETVINLFNKFTSMIKGFIDKIKNSSFANKSDADKLEVMIKKHPELKEKIIENSDKIDFSEIKTLAEVEDYYKKILEVQDPDKKKQLIDKMVNAAKITGAVAGAGVSIIKIGEFFSTMKNKNNDMLKQCQDKYNSLGRDLSNMRKQVNDLNLPKKADGSIDIDKLKNDNKQKFDYYNSLRLNIEAIQKNMAINAECMQRYERKANGFMKRALQTATRATGQGAQP